MVSFWDTIFPRSERSVEGLLPASPAIPSNMATALALMLHYAIRQETLAEQDIAIRITERHRTEDTSVATDQLQRHNKHWEMEDEILDKVRRGDTNISGL